MKTMNIVAYQCKKCGKLHFPYHDRCLSCKGREFEKVAPRGNAKLITFSQVFNLPWGFDNRFIFIGVAEFENGIKAMGQINANAPEELEPGMALRPTWDVVRVISGEKVYGLKFEPM
jgi:uncharacterized OB-fold protein